MLKSLLVITVLLAVSNAQKLNETQSDDAGANPQTRFLPGLLNIFNSCSRCHPGDQKNAEKCCRTGEKQCCFIPPSFSQSGFVQPGFQGHHQHGFGQSGFHGQGFGQPGFPGQQGFHGQGFGQPGFPVQQGFHGQGFGQPGFPSHQGFHGQQNFHGQFPGNGFNNFQQNTNVKHGFCRKQGLFGGLFTRSNAAGGPPGLRSAADSPSGASPGLRSAADVSDNAKTQEGRSSRRARQVKFPGTEEEQPKADTRSAAAQNVQADPAGGANPNTRFFLPNNLFGPGPVIPNPLCRDECFNDFDCPGNLKCCLRDCNKCENPSFF